MTRHFYGFTILALLAVTICAIADVYQAGSTSSSPADTSHSFARKLTLEGVPNFGEVTPRLYRGGQPTKKGFEGLAKMGIVIVVDAREFHERERNEVTSLGMRYVAIPWHCFYPKDAIFAQFLEVLRESPEKKIFIHCNLGDDRTGMMIAAYRMAEQGWTAEEAKKEMEAFGFSFFHHLYCPGLSSYEAKFPQQFKTSPAFQSLHPEHFPAQKP